MPSQGVAMKYFSHKAIMRSKTSKFRTLYTTFRYIGSNWWINSYLIKGSYPAHNLIHFMSSCIHSWPSECMGSLICIWPMSLHLMTYISFTNIGKPNCCLRLLFLRKPDAYIIFRYSCLYCFCSPKSFHRNFRSLSRDCKCCLQLYLYSHSQLFVIPSRTLCLRTSYV